MVHLDRGKGPLVVEVRGTHKNVDGQAGSGRGSGRPWSPQLASPPLVEEALGHPSAYVSSHNWSRTRGLSPGTSQPC